MATQQLSTTPELKRVCLLWILTTIAGVLQALVVVTTDNSPSATGIALLLTIIIGYLARKNYLEYKRASFAKEAKEKQLQFIFDSAPIGLYWTHQKTGGKRLERIYNPAHLEITGLKDEDMQNPNAFVEITHPEDRKRQSVVRKDLVEGKMKEVSMEKRYIRKDGEIVWVKASWKRLYDEDGNGFQEVSSLVDITASKESAEEFKRKESQLRMIFESSPVGLLWSYVDVPNDVNEKHFLERIVNPAHYKITGMDRERVKRKGAYDRISFPDELAIQKKAIADSIDKRDGSCSMEKRYLHPDGKVVWVSITWVRQWDEDMKRYREISTVVDITDQKSSAEKLERARIAAEEANRSKSQFLATMSHEIRTPMNGMIGMLHILENQLKGEQLQYLKVAKNSANELLALINEILDFSKIEAGKMEFENQVFPVDTFIEQACEIHTNNAFEKGLDLRLEIQPSAAIELNTDPHRLRQVITNLLSNAIKFTERGEIVVGARRFVREDGEDVLEIDFRDTGIGLTSEARGKLFQAFSQANASTTRKYGGTGLGLSICKHIIEHMKGSIGVDDQVAQGSRFWIQLPSTNAKPVEDILRPEDLIEPGKILLVEKNQAYVKSIQVWLSHWGFDTTSVSSFEEFTKRAEEAIDETPFKCLIINSVLFAQNQAGYTKMINETPKFNSTPVALLDKISNSPIQTLPDWIDHRISQPINIRKLMAVLEKPKAALTKSTEAPETVKKRPKPSANDTRVLVVEDNLTNRMVINKLFEIKHGLQPDMAHNGIEAIKQIKEKDYDIVFMDCMMPEMDGYEATKAIRRGEAGEKNQSLPIIALTAKAMEHHQNECIEAGMNDHISKPVDPFQMEEILKKWVRV